MTFLLPEILLQSKGSVDKETIRDHIRFRVEGQ